MLLQIYLKFPLSSYLVTKNRIKLLILQKSVLNANFISGQCLQCLGNTGGWHCDECLPGFYGNPLSGQCKGKTTSDKLMDKIENNSDPVSFLVLAGMVLHY